MDEDAEFARVQRLFPQAKKLSHGGKPVVLIEGAEFPGAGVDRKVDLLLYPHPDLGYATRLFYAEQLSFGQNWTQHTLCQRQWWSPSRDGVQATHHWDQILAMHLREAK